MIPEIKFDDQRQKTSFLSMMSLCKRAGQLVSGEHACENAIKAGKARIIFLSSDASGNTTKKFLNKSNYYGIPVYMLEFPKEQLGKMIGEAQRSVVAVNGGDFTERLLTITSSQTDMKA